MIRSRTLLIVLGCLTVFSIAADEPQVTVTLQSLVEKREANLSKEKDPFASFHTGVQLTAHFDGPAVVGARKYKHAVLTKAVDDLGTDLLAVEKGAPRMWSGYQDVPPPMGFFTKKQTKPLGFKLDIDIPVSPPRSAKELTLVTGTIDLLVGGERKTIEVKDLKNQYGKAVEDPALKEMGVTFTILDPASRPAAAKVFESKNLLAAKTTGDLEMLDEVKIEDGNGKSLSNGSLSTEVKGEKFINYELDAPLPADAVLKITFFAGQKKVTVPFKFENVKLP